MMSEGMTRGKRSKGVKRGGEIRRWRKEGRRGKRRRGN